MAAVSGKELSSHDHPAGAAGLGKPIDDQPRASRREIVRSGQDIDPGRLGIKCDLFFDIGVVSFPPVPPGMVPCRDSKLPGAV